jgi:hypothetical protein
MRVIRQRLDFAMIRSAGNRFAGRFALKAAISG